MHAQTRTAQHTSGARQTNTTTNTQAGARADKKAGLRGLSFAEGEQALSPDGATATTADAPGEVAWKGGVPPEIAALGLRHVKVTCTPEAWASLSEDEQAGVLTFLTQKDAQCEADKDLKSSRVEIGMGRRIRAEDDKDLAEQERLAAENQERLRAGEDPMGTAKVIGVKEGETKVTETQATRTTDIPIKEAKTMEDHFATAGSTFDSADYEPEDMQQGGVVELLEQAAQKILEYLALDPNAQVTVTVVASESHVTNPAQFAVPGSLAAARAANAVTLAQAHFGARGIPLGNVSFTTQNLGANGPAWDPKAGVSKHDPMYTEHQFVRLSLTAAVEVATGQMQQVTETIPETTRVGDSQIVKMLVDDRERTKIRLDGGNSFGVTKNQTHAKSDAPKHQRKNNANQCGP